MMKQHKYQKIFLTETVLRPTLVLFYKVFRSMIKKSLIFQLLRIQSIFFIVLMTLLKRTEIQDINCFILKKMLDTVGLQKVEERNKQFLIEKLIHGIEFKNLYETDSENKPEILLTIERNYRIARRVYQQLHNDTSDLFADFIRSLSVFEIQDMDEDIAVNGWGVKKMSEVADSEEMM